MADESDKDQEVMKEIKGIKEMLKNFLSRTEVLKQFNDKTFTIIEPLYTPFGKVDGHGDGYKDANGPVELVKSFEGHKDTLQKAINHTHKTDCFDIVKSWVTTKEVVLGGVTIPALQPLVELRYTEKAYNLRKQGKLLGPSIGCSAWTESVVKSLREEMKVNPKRLISEFDFSEKRHHLSLTTPAVGGPASQENWYVDMNKSKLAPEDLALLEELGEEFTELEKKQDAVSNQEKAPSTSELEAQDAGVDNKTLNKGKDDNMSDTITKAEFEALQAELAKMKADKEVSEKKAVVAELSKYSLDEEVATSLAGVMVAVEDYTVITKALDALASRVQEAETAKADLEKSVKTGEAKEPTQLEKDMSAEEGEGSDESLEKSNELTDDILKKYREMPN